MTDIGKVTVGILAWPLVLMGLMFVALVALSV